MTAALLIRIEIPDEYLDVHPDLILADLDIHSEFCASVERDLRGATDPPTTLEGLGVCFDAPHVHVLLVGLPLGDRDHSRSSFEGLWIEARSGGWKFTRQALSFQMPGEHLAQGDRDYGLLGRNIVSFVWIFREVKQFDFLARLSGNRVVTDQLPVSVANRKLRRFSGRGK